MNQIDVKYIYCLLYVVRIQLIYAFVALNLKNIHIKEEEVREKNHKCAFI